MASVVQCGTYQGFQGDNRLTTHVPYTESQGLQVLSMAPLSQLDWYNHRISISHFYLSSDDSNIYILSSVFKMFLGKHEISTPIMLN